MAQHPQQSRHAEAQEGADDRDGQTARAEHRQRRAVDQQRPDREHQHRESPEGEDQDQSRAAAPFRAQSLFFADAVRARVQFRRLDFP